MTATVRLAVVLVGLSLFVRCELASDRKAIQAARAAYERGEYARSATLLETHLRDNPKHTKAWIVLGNARAELDQDAEAAAAYQQALALDGKSVEALTGLGILAHYRFEYARAMELYRRAVAIDPSYAAAYTSMAIVSLGLEQDAQAVEYAEKAWRLDPMSGLYAANLAVAYHYAGRPRERDELKAHARRLGYRKIDTIEKIVSGEMPVRD